MFAEEHHMPGEQHRQDADTIDTMMCYEEPIGSLAVIIISDKDNSTAITSVFYLWLAISILIISTLTISYVEGFN
jgi:hypothetical protein